MKKKIASYALMLFLLLLMVLVCWSPAPAQQRESTRYANQYRDISHTCGIQEAYNDLPASGGHIVLGSDCLLNSNGTFTTQTGKDVLIDGQGRLLLVTSSSGVAFTLTASNINNRDNIVFENANFVCSGAGSGVTAFEVSAITNVKIDNVNVSGCSGAGQTGILLDDVEDSILHAVGAKGNTVGLQAQDFSNNTVCLNCRFNGNVLGWRVLDTSGFIFDGCLTQSNTGPHGGEVNATTQNITSPAYVNGWFENNGDGTANARHVVFTAAAGHVILEPTVANNTVNTLNGAGKAFEFVGPGGFAYPVFLNNQHSFTPSTFVAGMPIGTAGSTIIGQNESSNYDVGINAGTTADALVGVSFRPSTKCYNLFAGSPLLFDTQWVFMDCTAGGAGIGGVVLLAYTGTLWDFTKPVQIGAAGSQINAILNGTATLTYTSIAANSSQEQTITITGASTTNFGVFCSPRATLGNVNLSWSSWVSATNTITVRVTNPTAGAITPSAVAWGCTENQ